MANNDLAVYIGEMGTFQWRAVIAMFIIGVLSADSIQIIFLAGHMDHWCRVPELDDLPYRVQQNVSIPAESTNDIDPIESCEMYALNYSSYNVSEFYSWDRNLMVDKDTLIVECSEWIYDRSQYSSTIVSKFNLVCDRSFLVPLVSTIYMAGFLVGSVSSGAISDRFGRKKTMLIYYIVKLVGIIIAVFSPNYAAFIVGRILTAATIGPFITGFVLVMELVGKRYRTAVGISFNLAFSVGFMIYPAVAYGLRDEFWFLLASSAPNFLIPVLIIFVFPESPRWLAVQGRYEEVTKLLQKICKTNGRELPEDFRPTDLIDEETIDESKSCLVLLSTPTMRLWTLVMDFAWFTASMIYYAFAFNTGDLYGDVYLNTFLSALVELPALIGSIFLVNWRLFGRKRTGIMGFSVAAVSSFVSIPTIIFGFQTVTTVLSIFGKALISMCFSLVYLHASEMFPTEVRNVGVGTASMCARISTLAASFVGGPLGNIWKPLPSLVFGVFSTTAGLLYVLLPETLGKVLPDTVEQAEQLGKNEHRSPIEESRTSITASEASITESTETTPQNEKLPEADIFVISSDVIVKSEIDDLQIILPHLFDEKPLEITPF